MTEDYKKLIIFTGGHQLQNKKWLELEDGNTLFMNLDTIIYVLDISSYDGYALNEAFDLFDQMMRMKILQTVDFIMFLNKNDLFMQKIKEIPFSLFDPGFNSDLVHDANAVIQFVQDKFKKRFYDGIDPNKSQRRIHFHRTYAKDTNQMSGVMHVVKFEIIREILKRSMLF